MDRIFYAMIAIAFFSAALPQLVLDVVAPMYWGLPLADLSPMADLGTGAMSSAKAAIELAIGLVGYMALFLGLMKVAEAGGMLRIIAKLLRPLMTRLFPDVPPNHPAMGAMILNMSANAMGLGNAATPFGIRAMQELEKLNPNPGTATNSMALFLAINTSSVTLLPTGVIAIRASLGSQDPSGIMGPTLFATLCSTAVAITACLFLARFWPVTADPEAPVRVIETPDDDVEDHGSYPIWVSALAGLALLAFVPTSIIYGATIAPWIVPVLIFALLSFGVYQGVEVYGVLVEGAKDGWDVAVRIMPFLVAILAAVGMLRASGALGLFVDVVGTYTGALGMPAEALPMAVIRPLSGSGAFGVLMDTMNTYGPDSYIGYLVSTLQGSTETTFYVLAVYFGAVGVRRIRHSMAAALMADFAGICAAVIGATWYFGLL